MQVRRNIVAITRTAHAPIFDSQTLGPSRRSEQILPELTEAVKAKRLLDISAHNYGEGRQNRTLPRAWWNSQKGFSKQRPPRRRDELNQSGRRESSGCRHGRPWRRPNPGLLQLLGDDPETMTLGE